MYKFCKNNGIRLIILDIPQIYEDIFKSSIPFQLDDIIKNNSDIFIPCDEVLNDINDVAKIFVPHGHRHISEFTHLLLGIAVAKEILTHHHYFSEFKWE